MFAAANMAAQKPPGGFLQGVFWSRAGTAVPVVPHPAGYLQPGKESSASGGSPLPRPFSPPRRSPHRGQVPQNSHGGYTCSGKESFGSGATPLAQRGSAVWERRLAARGQVDSTGPRAIIQRSQLCLLRQRWLPCAKGAVGERRLTEWQRDASPPGLQGSFSRRWLASAGVGVPTKHTAWESFGRPDAGLTLARDSRWHGTHAGKNRSTS